MLDQLSSTVIEFVKECRGRRVLLESDSETTVQTVGAGYTRLPHAVDTLDSILREAVREEIVLRVEFVSGDLFNQVADYLSRNQECRTLDVETANDVVRLDVRQL